MNMTVQTSLKHSLICGLRVAGRGLEVSPPGKAIPWRREIAFKKGIIVIQPARIGGLYTVFDTETFSVVEARRDRLTLEEPKRSNPVMKYVTVISKARDCFIELTHRNSDPGVWIVRSWTKFLWFKKRISSDWFNDEQQAIAFANTMKRRHGGHQGHLDAKKSLQTAE